MKRNNLLPLNQLKHILNTHNYISENKFSLTFCFDKITNILNYIIKISSMLMIYI